MSDGNVGTIKFLDRDLPEIPTKKIAERVASRFGLEGDWHSLEGERDQVLMLDADSGRYVVRVSNVAEHPRVADFQVKALLHIERYAPDLPVPRVVRTIEGELVDSFGHEGAQHLLRLVTYRPGTPLREAPTEEKAQLRAQLGKTLARFGLAMRGFFHEAATNEHPWDIMRSPQLIDHTKHIADSTVRTAVEDVLEQFSGNVLPGIGSLRHQVIHQDAHGGNVLVDNGTVSGLIDFGDMVWGPLPSEIAIAADPAWSNGDPVGALCEIMAGFDATYPLEESEVAVLFDLVLARVAATLTIEAARQATSPDRSPAAEGIDRYAGLLDELLRLDRSTVDRRLRKVGRFAPTWPAPSSSDLAKRRRASLGPNAPHFYDQPLHIERGDGVWLYAPDGTAYLDFYNNVPQVGHNHPHVVNAISRQASALNTNSRYLYEGIVDYAERLTHLLGPGLDTCLFVNSGSEANDVALQMARFATGRSGVIVMDGAYHGVTVATREVSTADPDIVASSRVAELMVPDPYRGRYRTGEPELAGRYADDTERALTSLADHGQEVSAFVVDPAMCSTGMPSIPPGYLAEVHRRVGAAGGLFIVDEVQSGLGRTGRWWGHELHEVAPDIVTMGKPIGNGHPLGVVVTSAELLDAFLSRTRLFSTFGGNPVAAAAGMAVIDVIEREQLVTKANDTGAYLRKELARLQADHPLIGDVRGWGMIAGVELVTDRELRTPATGQTQQLIELMKSNGVLVGVAGRRGNVLKLRPPLIAERRHVDRFIEALASSLAAVGDRDIR